MHPLSGSTSLAFTAYYFFGGEISFLLLKPIPYKLARAAGSHFSSGPSSNSMRLDVLIPYLGSMTSLHYIKTRRNPSGYFLNGLA